MNKLAKVNQFLDDYLYGKMSGEAMQNIYQQHIEPAYKQLSFRSKPYTYYDSDTFVGKINPKGEVTFKRKIPGFGDTYYSPQELLDGGDEFLLEPAQIEALTLAASQPFPGRDLIKMNRAFNDYSSSPEGARLYYNIPASDHRAKAYLKQGFENVEGQRRQVLDRRFNRDSELFNKLYAIGDVNMLGLQTANQLLQQRGRATNLSDEISRIQNALPGTLDAINNGLYPSPF